MKATAERKLPLKIHHYVFGIGVVALFLGVILGAQLLGMLNTSGRVDAKGNQVQIKGTDVTELKGWMTLGDIATAYKVPLQEILTAFKLPAETPGTTAIKDLEGQGENLSTTTLRAWLAERLGNPAPVITPSAETKGGSGKGSATGATPKP